MRALWDWKEGIAKKDYTFDVDKTEGTVRNNIPILITKLFQNKVDDSK